MKNLVSEIIMITTKGLREQYYGRPTLKSFTSESPIPIIKGVS